MIKQKIYIKDFKDNYIYYFVNEKISLIENKDHRRLLNCINPLIK